MTKSLFTRIIAIMVLGSVGLSLSGCLAAAAGAGAAGGVYFADHYKVEKRKSNR